MKTVILAEKPSQAKAYASAFTVARRDKTCIELKPCSTFPSGAVITWGIGHLVSLKMPGDYRPEWKKWQLSQLPIVPPTFEFKVSEGKEAQFSAVQRLFKEADELINACDIDREGANIFYSIYNMTGVSEKPIKRLWINSLEEDEIRKGFARLQSNERDLLMYEEAKTRQISDWLVGMNASQLYTLVLKEKGLQSTLSVGRVQSPTVFMIYQRQLEIENFVSKPFHELFGTFNGQYVGKAKIKVDTMEEMQAFLKENQLLLETDISGEITSLEKKQKRQKAPKLHSLSTLQVSANRKWKYTPARVLEIMQSLYEKKLVTYPRTDTNHITDNEFQYLVKHIGMYQKLLEVDFTPNTKPNKRYVDASKVQEHYAIIPTKKASFNGLSQDEKNLYEEVLRTTLAIFHEDYVYEETKLMTTVKAVDFETTGKVELNEGWKVLFPRKKEAEKSLPRVVKGERVSGVLATKEGQTTPPKAYTEGDLINLMKTAGKLVEDEEESDILKEVEGIGTEATRAGIIETIKRNGYISVQKNTVRVTQKGSVLCQVIEGSLLASPVMTAKWERYLRKIGSGNGSMEAFVNNIIKFLVHLIQTVPTQPIGRINIQEETPVPKKTEAPKRQESKKAPQAKKRTETKASGMCPVCGQGKMVAHETFVGCSNYTQGCKFAFSKSIAGKNLTEGQQKLLVEKGKTRLIKGFKSKSGTSFEAYLVVKDGTVKFEFPEKKVT